MMQSFGQVLPPAHAIPLPSWMAMPVPTGTGCVHLPGGVLVRGGASRYDYPRVEIPEDADHPPVGIVLGAGAVGALTGHLVFHSLLLSAGLGIGAMSMAASSEGRVGDIARSSGRIALAAFERTAEVNRRYDLTDKLVDSVKSAARGLRRFDEEHKVVHKATERASGAWRSMKQFDDTHQLTARAGNALSAGFDKLSHILEPPTVASSSGGQGSSSSNSSSSTGGGSSGGRDHGAEGGDGGARKRAYNFHAASEPEDRRHHQASGMSSAQQWKFRDSDIDDDAEDDDWWSEGSRSWTR